MKSEVEVVTATQRRVRVEVPADHVGKAFARIYRQVGRQAKVRGFRAGKIPQQVLRGLYGTEIQAQALSELVEEALAGVMQDQGLEPVSEPRLEPGELNEAQPFAFTAVIEVKPEIELKNYRAVPVDRVRADIGEEEVERALKALQDRNAQVEAVEGRDEVQDGDYVLIDFSGSVDGEPFPGSTAENYAVDIGAGRALLEFEEGLVGMKQGVAGNIAVDFPAEVNDERLAGKTANFEVTVRDIRHKILPPLDDEFARDHGECDSLEELREKVRAELQSEIEAFQNGPLKDRIMERLIDEHVFEVSPSMVERELSYLMRRARSQRETSAPEDPEPTTDELREELTPQAERRVRMMLLLEKIAAAEGIDASDEEVDGRIEAMARASGAQAASVREQYGQAWARETMRSQLVSEKTLDFLLEEADITLVDPPEKGC
ncbi:MAG: trigger factor [Deltaproteobacteria bacterium]|nr:trigger factor [Deltaproteobacteria bacterium]